MAYNNERTNYEDAIMKMAWDTFAKEGRKLFGLTKKVKGPAKTELVFLDLSFLNLDYTYHMEDDSIEHYEFQTTNNNRADLIRFRAYESILSHQTGKPVITYVIYSSGIKNPNSVLEIGINTYRVIPLTLANIDGDAKRNEILAKVAKGKTLTDEDALNVMFLPLTGGKRPVKQKVLDSIQLAKHFNEGVTVNLEAMAYALAVKFLDENDLNSIKEEIRMTALGKMLIEDGKQEGKIEGLEEAAISLLDILDNETIATKLGLSLEHVKRLRKENEN